MAKVQLKNVLKRYGDVQVVHGVDLDIRDNEFIVLVGPSGCGKSTILRMIAGLESISGGEVFIGDRMVNNVSPKSRNVAMVFQNYALYPHMTVRENMGFSLKMAKWSKQDIDAAVKKAAAMLELEPYLDRKPSALSGGQRQRVAMGRAIVRQPDVFLFDEPLSNLDAQLRTQMRMELKKMHMRFNTTTIYVTHDQIEALTLADRIVILKDGYIQQVGTPIEVYEEPANEFVARFIGNPPMNILTCRVVVENGVRYFKAKDLKMPLPAGRGESLKDGDEVRVGIRPDAIKVGENVDRLKPEWRCEGTISLAEIVGGQSILEMTIAGNPMLAEVDGRIRTQLGEIMPMGVDIDRLVLFDPVTAEAL